MTAAIIIVGIIFIGALGIGRRKRSTDMDQWVVGKRDFPRWTSWFLQAGESLGTFTFLGLAGLAFVSGASATYSIGYLTAYLVLRYFIGPRIRNLGAQGGYLTQADFFQDRYKSRAVGVIVGLVGAGFMIPSLVLNITGLGQIVALCTNGTVSAQHASIILSSVLIAIFVMWAGIRGIARVSIFKDVAVLLAVVVVSVAVLKSTGGFPHIFDVLQHTQAPGGHGGTYSYLFTTSRPGTTWFVTSVIISTLTSGFLTAPYLFPPVLAADSGQVLRSNYKWLGVYQLILFLPVIIGMAAVLKISPKTSPNGALFTVSAQSMPAWLLGCVAVAGVAAAMAPAAGIAMAISSTLSNNVLYKLPASAKFRVNQLIVVLAIAVSLGFSLKNPDMTKMLLLSIGGLAQMVPAVAAALPNRVRLHWTSVFCGIATGVLTVAWLTWGSYTFGNGEWDSGLLALAPNLVVTVLVEGIVRAMGASRAKTRQMDLNTFDESAATVSAEE